IRTQAHMRQRGQFAPHALLVFEIDRCNYHSFLIGGARQHPSPGIDDHRITVIAETMDVWPELCRCDYVHLVLNRTRAQQSLPMSFAGWESECAGHRDYPCTAEHQGAVQFGEPDVVTNGKADLADRSRDADDLGARQLRIRFADRDPSRKVDI